MFSSDLFEEFHVEGTSAEAGDDMEDIQPTPVSTSTAVGTTAQEMKGKKRTILHDPDSSMTTPVKPRTYPPAPAVPAAPTPTPTTEATKQDPVRPDDSFRAPTAEEARLMRHDLHDVAIPDGYEVKDGDYDAIHAPRCPDKLIREYPFTLDPFQKNAIACLEREESVLVSAHTSAGKTVVAEYAIALALRDQQRIVYTSPIKALSNQKYRELHEEFQDVGLMTGDVTINPNASCIVMTTEILRSMLYRGSEILREIKWVVMDEIHYMRDSERGVVWEETIILLPDTVKFVFLSATIPNAMEFAGWVAKIHTQPCHVVYTDFRPTPLQHYVFPEGGSGLYLVVNELGQFRQDNFQKASDALAAAPLRNQNQRGGGGGRGRGRKGGPQRGGPSDIYKIIKMIMERKYDPVIVFAFSKKECERLALQMTKLDFNTEDEKHLVNEIFNNAIDSLNDDDRALPQVENILPLLRQGIGIHHSGLLPILKEVIEILFQEGLIKALFATETFSMGLNMPAKTVVFTNVRKFDGKAFRWISSGEYIQMSGRAGRRGLDDRGIVIMMVAEKMEPEVVKGIIKGEADPLNSAFQLSYNMLLNLTRVEEMHAEDMLRHSFRQYQNDLRVPAVQEKIKILEEQRDAIVVQDETIVAEYYNIRSILGRLADEMRGIITQPMYILPFLQPGRLVRIKDGVEDWGWGVVVNFQRKDQKASTAGSITSTKYIVDVLLRCVKQGVGSVTTTTTTAGNKERPKPALSIGSDSDGDSEMRVIPVMLPLINNISAVRVFIPRDLRSNDNRKSVGNSIREVERRFPDGLPLLDPIEDMQIESSHFKKLIRKTETLEDRLHSSSQFKFKAGEGEGKGKREGDVGDGDGEGAGDGMIDRYDAYCKKMEINQEISTLNTQYRGGEHVVLLDELKAKKRVLRRLGYTDEDNIIQTKGRVACELNTSDELLVTELMFNGVFNDLSVVDCVALLSCFIFDEKTDEDPKLDDSHSALLRRLQDEARNIARVSTESKLVIDAEEYAGKFSPSLMEVSAAWADGRRFAQIMGMTDIFEGSIIRGIRRLDEVLHECSVAAKSIGNTELEAKFTEGSTKIKRDIIFAASLYL